LLAADTATLFIMATGLTFVIMLGGIDLSVQVVASLASVVLAVTLPSLGLLALPLAVLTGAAAGFCSGLAQVRLKVPSFIATLAMSGIAAALALVLSGTRSVPIPPETRQTVFAWVTGTTVGIPHAVLVGLAVLALALFIERRTLFGRWSVAVGAGEPAALVAGVPVGRVKVTALVLSGALAAFAGMVLGARLSSGSPTLANEFLLPAVAAVCVGGTALTGGVGGVLRTLTGALIISVVRIGMTFVGVDVFAQSIVFGAVLVLAVAATIDRSKIAIVK
jgi:ribose transport system permease protein